MNGHLDDLLSAYADGELTTTQQSEVEAHLEQCPACRRELIATEQAKSWLASLPLVLPPFGFYERMLLDPASVRSRRARWPVRTGAIGLAATASIWFGVIGLARLDGGLPAGMPALNSLVSLHQGSATPAPDAPSASSEDPAVLRRAAALGLPPEIDDGYRLSDVLDRGAEQQAVYSDGEQAVSVFVFLRYRVNEAQLPAGTTVRLQGGQPVWIVPYQGRAVLVAQRGTSAIVVVGPEPASPSMTGDVDPPSPGRSIADRVQSAGDGLLEAFGLG